MQVFQLSFPGPREWFPEVWTYSSRQPKYLLVLQSCFLSFKNEIETIKSNFSNLLT